MKKFLYILIFTVLLLTLASCGKTKILHCDNCNAEISVSENSNMDEEWTVFCDECNEELFADNPLLNGD